MRAWLTTYVTCHFDCEFHQGSSRDFERAHNILKSITFPTEKPPAMVTIDDRALRFTGEWSDFDPQKLLKLKPWNKE